MVGIFHQHHRRYAYVSLYPRNDRMVRIRSLDLGHTITFDVNQSPIYDGVLDLAKAVIYRLRTDEAWSWMCGRRPPRAADWGDLRP